MTLMGLGLGLTTVATTLVRRRRRPAA